MDRDDATQSLPENRVNARPEKRFFLEILTRDIEVIPAISDLVDNSVDGALQAAALERDSDDGMVVGTGATPASAQPLAGFWVQIKVDGDQFVIEDNCGGIPRERARRYAFRFGRAEDVDGVAGGTGQFGVGMKRALFKIGRQFTVGSATTDGHFVVDVRVDDWAGNNEWTFPLDVDTKPDLTAEVGTRVHIKQINPEVRREFERATWLAQLRAALSMNHQRPLVEGLSITVNGSPLKPYRPMIAQSDEIVPLHRSAAINTDKGTVSLKIVAGLHQEDVGDEPAAEARTTTEQAGWYVYCNRRLVLAGEKTSLTGWGDGSAKYHPQYRAFRGFCYLEAENPAALPWNTTKTGVDRTDDVYVKAREHMTKALAAVQAGLNSVKKERSRTTDETKRSLARAISTADQIDPATVQQESEFKYPEANIETPQTIAVQYDVDRDRMQEVQEILDVDSARQAGLKTFEYFYENEV